ncbi:MAG: TetR/AcrR family transcriptional regulator [Actinomycetota bacterium]|nr:TetR/AcrR family transcriptional regulator [Actinomycetota bacterium]
MGRTREAALSGAVLAVVKYGSRKATMGDIAMLAGIAKATLYNHFRTRDDVYAAVVAAEVDAIARAATAELGAAGAAGSAGAAGPAGPAGPAGQGFAAALAAAARLVAEHPAVRKVATDDPAALAALAAIGEGQGWTSARSHLAAALRQAGYDDSLAVVDLVLRYLVSQLLAPAADPERRAAAALLTGALPAAVATAAAGPAVVDLASPPADRSPAAAPPAPDPADTAHTSS